MTDRRIALAWVGGVLLVGSLLDAWLYFRLGNGATISQSILWLSRKCFLVPMAFGWMCGHFFWPRAQERSWGFAATLTIWWTALLLMPLWTLEDTIKQFLLIPFLFGVLSGHVLTPQTDIPSEAP